MVIGISTRTRPQESRGKDRNSLIYKKHPARKSSGETRSNPGDRWGFELQPMCGDRRVADGAPVESGPAEFSPAGIQFQWFG